MMLYCRVLNRIRIGTVQQPFKIGEYLTAKEYLDQK